MGIQQMLMVGPTGFLNTTGVAATDGAVVGWRADLGSMVTSVTSDGKILGVWADNSGAGTFVAAGFGSDPGQNGWATSFTIDSTTLLAADAASYNYSSGTATWEWAGPFGFADATPFTAVIE